MQSLSKLLSEINNDWYSLLLPETEKTYFKELEQQILASEKRILPPENQIFRVFQDCSLDQLKVVILGQDPYPGAGQANGLSFSVNRDIEIPRSLRNIYKELHQDLNCPIPSHGDLSSWVNQGVFLLNASLSVEEGNANSHAKWGWHKFLSQVIQLINKEKEQIVFILWGKFAQKQKVHIDIEKHLVLESAHPSPLGAYRGFWDSKPFSKCNQYLKDHQLKEIDWCVK